MAKRWEIELTTAFTELLDAWEKEDSSGMVARYPETKNRHPRTLMHADAFDLESLVDECESVLEDLTELLDEPGLQAHLALQAELADEYERREGDD